MTYWIKAQPDYWGNFHQWERPIYWTFSNMGYHIAIYRQSSAHVDDTGWGSSVVTSYNYNPDFGTFTGIWGGIFSHSTVNWSGNWGVSFNASPNDSSRIHISPRITQRYVCKYFLHRRRQQHLWRQSNISNPQVCRKMQEKDFSGDQSTE